MVGSEPERVQSEISWHPQTGADENTAFTVRFKNDVIANVLCSQGIAAGSQVMDYIEIIGSEGRIRADWPSNVVQVQSRALPEYSHPTTIRPQKLLTAEMYRDEVRDWADSLSQKREPPITADDGLNVLQIIDAVFESGRNRNARDAGLKGRGPRLTLPPEGALHKKVQLDVSCPSTGSGRTEFATYVRGELVEPQA